MAVWELKCVVFKVGDRPHLSAEAVEVEVALKRRDLGRTEAIARQRGADEGISVVDEEATPVGGPSDHTGFLRVRCWVVVLGVGGWVVGGGW